MGNFFNLVAGLYLLSWVVPYPLFVVIVLLGFAGLWVFTSSGMTLRQKLTIATWSPSDDGHIFAQLEIDATKLKSYIEEVRKKTGKKVTITHLVGRATGLALKNSSLNGRIAFGRYMKNESVDASFLVQLDDGKNLAPHLIKNLENKSLVDIYSELNEGAGKLRKNEDEDFKKNMDLVRALPTFLLRPITRMMGILTGDLAIGIPALGVKARPMGCCMITSIGMLGVESAIVPFTPFAKTPVLLVVGAIKDQPAVRDGKVVPVPTLKISITLDHRLIDGTEGAKIGKRFQDLLENPENMDKKNS